MLCYVHCTISGCVICETNKKLTPTGREVSVRSTGPCKARGTVTSAQPQLKRPLRAASQALDVEAVQRRARQSSLATGAHLQCRGGSRRATNDVWTTWTQHNIHRHLRRMHLLEPVQLFLLACHSQTKVNFRTTGLTTA